MICLFWNCRGVGGRSFPGLIKELKHKYHFDILFLFETRSNGIKARKIVTKLGFKNNYIVDSVGFSGGLWALWNDSDWSAKVLDSSDQCVHIQVSATGKTTFLTGVYASPNPVKRRSLWRKLKEIQSTVVGPWCVGGDFNSILFENERRSRKRVVSSVDRDFYSWFEYSGLSHIHTAGPFFTWRREGCESKLDRVLINNEFLDEFPNAVTKVLSNFKSDHNSLLVTIENPVERPKREAPFRFVASWLLHEGFNQFMDGVWSNTSSWFDNLHLFTEKIKTWRVEVYGHLGRRKGRILQRLEGIIQSSHFSPLSSSLLLLQRDLWKELEEIILHEDLLWAQKSRCEWFTLGDNNTRYFHRRANARKKSKTILAIQNENGDWINNEDEIKSLAVGFFKNLFTEERGGHYNFHTDISYPSISNEVLSGLNCGVRQEEINQDFMSMGALKAPGPDELNALFFQS